MNSEILFGEVEQPLPQQALRPDQDGQLSVATVGQADRADLPIYVDLDVMRDMEAHAQTDTSVELGGVMLGRQFVDNAGQPFVVVTDCLRARHYQATRGSFKFTHETWSQITQDRKKFHDDLQMVGWYHTHPGWGVFLSGMDQFICDNFFGRPLDLALVIDPCADQRGWFFWTGAEEPEQKKLDRAHGFYLTAHRFRQRELDYFVKLFQNEPDMSNDPRYSGSGLGVNPQPLVYGAAARSPWFDMAVISMLMLQFLLVAMLVWKVAAQPGIADGAGQGEGVATQSQTASLDTDKSDLVWREMLQSLVAAGGGEQELVDQYAQLHQRHEALANNLEGQLAYIDQLKLARADLRTQLTSQQETAGDIEQDLAAAKVQLEEQTGQLAALTAERRVAADGTVTFSQPGLLSWYWTAGASLAAGVLFGLLGYSLGRKEEHAGETESAYEVTESEVVSGLER